MIHNLKLKNFKRHAAAEFTFLRGLNVVRGPNGSGKTSIQKAILYALAGASAAGAKDHLKRWGSKEGMSVELVLDLPPHGKCTVFRGPSSAKVTAEEKLDVYAEVGMRRGPRLLASGHAPVTAFIEEAFGMDGRTFRMLAYSPQGETAGLLALGATALQRKVEEIAKVDIIDRVINLVSQDVSRYDGELAGLGEIPDVEDLGRQLKAATAAELEAKQALEIATINLQGYVTRKQETEAQYHAVHAIEEEVMRLEKAVEDASVAAREGQERHSKIALELGQYAPDLDKILTDSEEAQRIWCDWVAHVKDLARREASTSQTLGVRRAHREDLDVKLVVSNAAIAQHAEKLPQVEKLKLTARKRDEEASFLTRQLQEANQAVRESKCPTCGREYTEGCVEHAQERLDAIRPLHQEALARATAAGQLAQEGQAELDRISQGIRLGLADEYTRVATEMAALEQELEELRTVQVPHATGPLPLPEALSTVTAYCQACQERCKELRELHTQVRVLRGQLESERGVMARAEADLKGFRTKLEARRPELLNRPGSAELAHLWSAQNADVERTQGEVNTLGQSLLIAQGQATELSRWVQEAARRAGRRREIEKEVALIKELAAYLRTNRARLVSELWNGLVAYASGLIDMVTGGRLSALRREDSGDFWVLETENGLTNNVPITELSGAQRAIVGVSLRLALSMVFYGPGGVLLLDEISADMDDGNAAATAGMLMGLPNQVLLVTHRQGDAAQSVQTFDLAA